MMKKMCCIMLILFLAACSNSNYNSTNVLKDIDGNIYKTIKIGNQIWMAENLKATHYRNGDKIERLEDESDWDCTEGAYCYYGNDTTNIRKYGLLYNWFAINDIRKIAPEGWHVPTDAEWQILIDFLGGENVAGGKMKQSNDENNKSKFSAVLGGYRYNSGVYDGIEENAYFWSFTESNEGNAWYRYLYSNNEKVYRDDSGWKQAGYNIRCIKD